MFRTLKRLKILFQLIDSAMRVEDDIPWTKGNTDDLRMFFETPTGKKLSRKIKNLIAETNAYAVQRPKDIQHNAGIARGYQELGSHIFSWSATFQPQMEEYEGQGDETGLDNLANLVSENE